MRIATYNVNGIRAAQKKGLADWAAAAELDVLCIQETKAEAEQVDTADFTAAGFVHQHWHSCRRKRGYSGVMTMSRRAPERVGSDIGMEDYDCEGRILRTDFGELTILNCYFPNGGQGDERQDFKYRFLDDFLAHVKELRRSRPNVLVLGDYNIAHTATDLHAPKRNENTTGFLPAERAWMTRWFAESGTVDAYRHLHPTTTDVYSWWSYRANARNNNKGWRIDYHSLNHEWADRIRSVTHLPDVRHSDHCPIILDLDYAP